MAIFWLLALIVALMLLRVNLVLILLAVAAYLHVVYGGHSIENIAQDMWNALDQELILSIPLFLLLASVMNRGRMARYLVDIMVVVTRRLPAGLALATILSCAIFSAVSGSSIVTMLAVGTAMYPALLRDGYTKSFAIGAICAGGSLGIIIPPSIPMILYGVLSQSSVTDLFIAGLGPGLLLTAAFSSYAMFVNRRLRTHHSSTKSILDALWEGKYALAMPVIMLGGIYSGYMTPTEAATISLVYAVCIETFVYREIDFAEYGEIAVASGKLLGAILPLVAIAFSINIALTEQHVPQKLVDFMLANASDALVFLLLINLLLMMLGCFMDAASAMVVTIPLLRPLADAYGVSATHLGVLMTLNLEIGTLTPPFGINLIVATAAFNQKFGFVCRAAIPWILIMILCLLLVLALPWIALGLLK
ncbi:MAG: hypothetical protein MnENMB40S_27460 [Rhizobiaceae bacterium MnEN-MB40S]|nr:MAG: hypothetical protein MnENMB40S_27460 [Rhizobiaceae bacterium MnEN-MB40S]